MMFTERHGRELAEIKSLAHELDQRVHEGLGQLRSIRESQDEALLRAGRGLRDAREVVAADERQPGSAVDENRAGPLLAFVHIPKTAGTTVKSMLIAAYSKSGVHPAGNYVKGPEKTAIKITRRPGGWETWQRQGGRVTVGHVPYGLFREHLPPNARYMTFLREPVDRVLSHYYRHIHHPELSRAKRMERTEKGRETAGALDEALIELRVPQLKNLCTRFLCGHESPMGDLPASALDEAKANLRGFAFVGIQERFEESLVLLQRMLGLDSPPYRDRHVSSDDARPAVDEIPDEQRALIEECNQLDVELYRFGLGLFEEAVAAAGEGFEADVEAVRTRSAEAREEEWHEARGAGSPAASTARSQ